jgi:hypothetical protein
VVTQAGFAEDGNEHRASASAPQRSVSAQRKLAMRTSV